MDQSQIVRLIAGICVLLMLIPTAFVLFKQNNALRNVTIWVAVFAALMWGYHIVVEKPALDAAPAAVQETPAQDTPPTQDNTSGPAVRHL